MAEYYEMGKRQLLPAIWMETLPFVKDIPEEQSRQIGKTVKVCQFIKEIKLEKFNCKLLSTRDIEC